MEPIMTGTWREFITNQFKQDSGVSRIAGNVSVRRRTTTVYPSQGEVFNAFKLTPFENVKVVILGQDPYHGPDQAHGLAFSVNKGVKIPPSLRNIFIELAGDIPGYVTPQHGDLTGWAEQGVLLLNSTLTVERGCPNSHKDFGWQTLTDRVIKYISDNKEGVVFLLWGSFAKEKRRLINTKKHHILEATHPSPFSAHSGFFGCRHFSKTNEILKQSNQKTIKW